MWAFETKADGYEKQLVDIAAFLGKDATDPSGNSIAEVVVAEIEQLREAIRVRGGCRLLSEGEGCGCGLCTRDHKIGRLITVINRLLAAISEVGIGLFGPASSGRSWRHAKAEWWQQLLLAVTAAEVITTPKAPE
jgi:hypothetical protein